MFKEDVYQFVKQNNRHVIIGFGAYGEVKLARNAKTKENVAIKLIYGKNAQHQISLHRQLNHPNIIKLYNHYYDSERNTTFMVLEYAGGGSLHRYIKTNCLNKKEIKRIFREVCEGVQVLHKNKLMHRDIKPENVLLTDDKQVKLCDFGFASLLGQRKTMCGTYQYMSPEMIQKHPYDHNIDIWALGILLYQMVQGNAPFAGNTPQQVLNQMKKVIMFSDNFVTDSNDQENFEGETFQQTINLINSGYKKSIRTTVSSGNSQKQIDSAIFSSVGKSTPIEYFKDLRAPTSPYYQKQKHLLDKSIKQSFKEHYSLK